MMPSFGPLARVLAEQLRVVSAIEDDGPMTTPSMVREQLYLCSAQLLRAGGPGVLRDVADSALASCHLELYAEAEAGADAGQPPPAKRRKSGAEPEDGGSGAWRATQHSLLADFSAGRSIGAQAAAIDLVEALFQGGGAVLPAPQRLRLDAMAAHLAATCRAAATAVRRGGQGRDAGGALKSLQAAAYRALLASISTPVPHRPVFLPQAVAAFREGVFDSDAAVSAVCRDALRVVEVMLHPRALPFARELRVAAADSRAPESGALEVPALGQPRMWSALTAQPGLAACIALPEAQPHRPAPGAAAPPAQPNLQPPPAAEDVAAAPLAAAAAAPALQAPAVGHAVAASTAPAAPQPEAPNPGAAQPESHTAGPAAAAAVPAGDPKAAAQTPVSPAAQPQRVGVSELQSPAATGTSAAASAPKVTAAPTAAAAAAAPLKAAPGDGTQSEDESLPDIDSGEEEEDDSDAGEGSDS